MHFYKNGNKQMLDLSRDLVITTQSKLVTASSRSAAPHKVTNGCYVILNRKTSKIKASAKALWFIWTEGGKL